MAAIRNASGTVSCSMLVCRCNRIEAWSRLAGRPTRCSVADWHQERQQHGQRIELPFVAGWKRRVAAHSSCFSKKRKVAISSPGCGSLETEAPRRDCAHCASTTHGFPTSLATCPPFIRIKFPASFLDRFCQRRNQHRDRRPDRRSADAFRHLQRASGRVGMAGVLVWNVRSRPDIQRLSSGTPWISSVARTSGCAEKERLVFEPEPDANVFAPPGAECYCAERYRIVGGLQPFASGGRSRSGRPGTDRVRSNPLDDGCRTWGQLNCSAAIKLRAGARTLCLGLSQPATISKRPREPPLPCANWALCLPIT